MSIRRNGMILGGQGNVDGELDASSLNPVQNRIVTEALGRKADLENGKVPQAQLPAMDYIPTSEKGAANGVAGLDAQGKVPEGELPIANGLTTKGILKQNGSSQQSGLFISNGLAELYPITYNQIDTRSSDKSAVTGARLDYAVRSVLPNVTAIPAATTAYSLLDASATTNNHSFTYTHVPDSAPTYTLPTISDSTRTHDIILNVLFRGYYRSATDDSGSAYAWKAKDGALLYTDTATPTVGTTLAYSDTALTTSVGAIALYNSVKSGIAMVGSLEFEDAGGNTLTPLDGPSPAVGAEICYLCEWSALQGQWTIMPIGMGGEA